jgi:alcohol dehydrogenase (cytochrome c)
MLRTMLFCGAAATALLLGLPSTAAEIKNYSMVTKERLLNPEPGNWMHYRRTYDGQGYSPLDKINASNVQDLVPVWTFSTGVVEGHQAPAIVNNGVMFISTPENQVIALDAKTGEPIWRYKRELPDDLFQLHPTNRGVGLWEDKLFLATVDCFVVALDAKTGKMLWETKVQDYKKGQYLTLMPLVVDGKVVIGGSGGEFGVRGYVAAYSAKDGKELWRTYTIPGPGEPGHETWQGDDWKTGGGSAWMTGNYDPQLNLIYWGTGNAAPWPGDAHPGDNLYTTSVLALEPDTGKIRTHFQYHQNDSWDWDEVEAPMLIDLDRGGRTIKSLVHPGRNGYIWTLERQEAAIKFVSAVQFVKHNAFKGIDPNGKPIVDVAHKPVLGKKVAFCPSLWGGKDWPSAAYSPKTRLVYIPANENLCGEFEGIKEPLVEGKLWLGTDPAKLDLKVQPNHTHVGELQAWDLATNKKVWHHEFPKSQLFAPVLATAGDLVFVGGTNDRMFRAFDAKSGKVLWEQRTNSGVTAAPVAYEVDGVQYIAVQAGWGVDAQRIQDAMVKLNLGYNPDVPQGGVVWVFALKSSQR